MKNTSSATVYWLLVQYALGMYLSSYEYKLSYNLDMYSVGLNMDKSFDLLLLVRMFLISIRLSQQRKICVD